jgi:hypothetical protein
MTVRVTNLTGKDLYYKVLDFEGPFANFEEQLLPGQYPPGQEFVRFDNNTQRHTLSSRYPRYNANTQYLPASVNGNFAQQPSNKSYSELRFQFPHQRLNGKVLDGNYEGVIPKGLHRDIMLKDINCNIQFRTFGKATTARNDDPDRYVQSNGAPIAAVDDVIGYDDPRLMDYEGIIKVARLRETNILIAIARGETFYMYDNFGVRIQLNFGLDVNIIPLYPPGTKQHSMGVMPKPHGTYVDSLRREKIERYKKYSNKYADMVNSNYSDDYDLPDLGYFDRRWLPGPRLP